jgi:hypothetical protein
MASLELHPKDARPTPSNLPARELIACPESECGICGTLSYIDAENCMIGEENNLEVMRRTAKVLMAKDHPHLSLGFYVWGGPRKGWLDKEAARVAGL